MAWIAEHLVDLLLRKVQMKAVTGSEDSSYLLAQIAQITILREQAKKSHLRSLHLRPTLTIGPHHSLPFLLSNLIKILS